MFYNLCYPLTFLFILHHQINADELAEERTFSVEGRVVFNTELQPKSNWYAEAKVLLDYGKYMGFIRSIHHLESQIYKII